MDVLDMDMLYKTPNPEHLERRDKPEDFAPAEYKQLVLRDDIRDDGTFVYSLAVFHGYWDEATKEPKHNRAVIDVPYNSQFAAEQAYRAQLDLLVRQGFIYAFIHPGPFASDPGRRKYRVLESGKYE